MHPGFRSLAALAQANPRQWGGMAQRFALFMPQVPNPFDVPDPTLLPAQGILLGYALDEFGLPVMPVYLPPAAFSTDLLFAGLKGGGKSWLITHCLETLIETGATVIIFDTEDEYAPMLVPRIPASHLAVYGAGSFKFNPHEPQGNETPREAIARVSTVAQEDWIGIATGNILEDILLKQLAERTPTVRSVLEALERQKRRVRGWKQLDQLDALWNRYNGFANIPMFDCVEGMPLSTLMKRSSIFRLHRVDPKHRGSVIRHLIAAMKVVMDIGRDSDSALILTFDELHRIVTRDTVRGTVVGSSIIEDAGRSLRKRNGGIIYGDQLVHKLPDDIVGNTLTKFIFQLIDGKCKDIIMRSLDLNPAQREFLTKLPPRHCLLWSKELQNQRLLLRVPDLDYSRQASGAEIALRMKESVEGQPWRTDSEPVESVPKAEPTQEGRMASQVLISKAALDYLADAAQRPFLWMRKRDASLKLSAQMADNIRRELLNEGMILVRVLKSGGRGGVYKLVELTSKAEALLDDMKVPLRERRGKGGFLHQAAQWHVAKWFRNRGGNVVIEDIDCDVSVDGILAVEILVTGVQKELKNIERDLHLFKDVLCVCDDREKLEALREKVEKDFPGRAVKFSLLARFLED